MTEQTVATLLQFVADIHTREGATQNTRLYRTLITQFLARVYRASRGYPVVYTNGVGGDLTITGLAVPLPNGCEVVERVEWDGSDNPLDLKSIEWLDVNYVGWRDETGDPSFYAVEGKTLYLNSQPQGAVTGKLVVRAREMPETDDIGIAYLPLGEQYAPAYDVLARLRADPKDPDQMLRKQEYATLAKEGYAACLTALDVREKREFRF